MPVRRLHLYDIDPGSAKGRLFGVNPTLLVSPLTTAPANPSGHLKRNSAVQNGENDSFLHIYHHDSSTSVLSMLVSRNITSAEDALDVAPPMPYTDVEGVPVCCLGGNGGARGSGKANGVGGRSSGQHSVKSTRNRHRNWRPCKTCSGAKVKVRAQCLSAEVSQIHRVSFSANF